MLPTNKIEHVEKGGLDKCPDLKLVCPVFDQLFLFSHRLGSLVQYLHTLYHLRTKTERVEHNNFDDNPVLDHVYCMSLFPKELARPAFFIVLSPYSCSPSILYIS